MVWRDDLHDASDEIPNSNHIGVQNDHDNHGDLSEEVRRTSGSQ